MLVYNTTIYFIYFKIIYHQGDVFWPSLGHPQALKENRSKTTEIFFTKTRLGIPVLTECLYRYCWTNCPEPCVDIDGYFIYLRS